jgi:hypothetical protein
MPGAYGQHLDRVSPDYMIGLRIAQPFASQAHGFSVFWCDSLMAIDAPVRFTMAPTQDIKSQCADLRVP